MRSSFKIVSWSKMSTYLGTVMSNCIKFLTFSLIPMWDLNPRPYVWGHLLIKSLYKNSPQNFRVTKVVCITFKCRNRDTSKKKSKEGKSLCTKMFHVAQVRKKLLKSRTFHRKKQQKLDWKVKIWNFESLWREARNTFSESHLRWELISKRNKWWPILVQGLRNGF